MRSGCFLFCCDLLLRGEMLGRLPSIFSKMEVHCVENCWEIPSQMKYSMWKHFYSILYLTTGQIPIATGNSVNGSCYYMDTHLVSKWARDDLYIKAMMNKGTTGWVLSARKSCCVYAALNFQWVYSRLIMTNTARDSTNKKDFQAHQAMLNKRVYHCLHVKVTWNSFNPGKFS